ncbi:MAG: hypothetical protein ACRCTZ_00290 [Sarcina sp.]
MIFYIVEHEKGTYKTKTDARVELIECNRIIGTIEGAVELQGIEEAIAHFELTLIEE